MARMTQRKASAAVQPDRPEVPGLEVGKRYRRRRGAPVRWDRHPEPETHPDAGPLVEYVEGAKAGDKWEGLGGWFRAVHDKTQHFYLAEDVVEASKSGAKARAGRSDAPPGQTCYAGDGRDRYSQGLCTKHYARARKLVKEGAGWDEAREAVREEEKA